MSDPQTPETALLSEIGEYLGRDVYPCFECSSLLRRALAEIQRLQQQVEHAPWKASYKDAIRQRDEAEAEVARLTGERDGARLVARQMQERLEAAQGEREALIPYLQHKPKCAKSTRETIDGHRVRLTPWEADQRECTCGLSTALAPTPTTED